jgi:hypothetical protein
MLPSPLRMFPTWRIGMNWPLPHMIMQQTGFIVQSEVQCLFVRRGRIRHRNAGFIRQQHAPVEHLPNESGIPQMGGTAASSIQLHHSHLLE